MSSQPRLFRIEHVDAEHTAKQVEEVDFSALGLRERQDIQEWVAAHPDILGDDLLIIAKEFNAFDGTNERADLVGVDSEGAVVIIELKRDDSGADVHWQAVKYASYFIVELLADYANWRRTKRQSSASMGIEDDDLSGLNRRQRASHRAPEVSRALAERTRPDYVCNLDSPSRPRRPTYRRPHARHRELEAVSGHLQEVPSSRGNERYAMRNVDERVLEMTLCYTRQAERMGPSNQMG